MIIVSKIFGLANRAARHTRWYQRDYGQVIGKFWSKIPFNLDIVNLGSFPGVYAFCYDEVPLKGRNWALGPQSMVYDYSILRNYSSYLRYGATVIISLVPFSCLFTYRRKDYYYKYFTILHPATIPDFDEAGHTLALEMKRNPMKYAPFYCIRRTVREMGAKVLSWARKKKPARSLSESADSFIDGWKKQFGISDLSTPLTEEHKAQQKSRRKTLMEMVEFCKERGFRPVIVIPPMHHTLWRQFPEPFLGNYISPLVEGIDAPFLNYMRSAEFDKDEYFSSALFMNATGAKAFTRKLLTDLGLNS
ncbi:MAG: hypothetical protein LUI08_03895 [Prevotella sp.]|nr:hypothetical protein [Prevotella sp.]